MKNGFTNDDQGNATKVPSSRRSFLTRAAGVSALAVPTLTLITSRKARAAAEKNTDRTECGVDPGDPERRGPARPDHSEPPQRPGQSTARSHPAATEF